MEDKFSAQNWFSREQLERHPSTVIITAEANHEGTTS
jgi:hypothetical protein